MANSCLYSNLFFCTFTIIDIDLDVQLVKFHPKYHQIMSYWGKYMESENLVI